MVHAGQTVKKGDILLKLSQNSIQAALKNLDDKVKLWKAGKGSGKPEKGEQPEACSGADSGTGNSYDLACAKAEMFPWIMQGRKFR